ncbi:MAG: hypothetical protein RSE58_08605 [Clostridia bacterium]
MELRLLDEVLAFEGRGIALLCLHEESMPLLASGMRITDARGNTHTVALVEQHDSLCTLLLPDGDAAYFERLFRDVRIDATLFTFDLKDVPPCP